MDVPGAPPPKPEITALKIIVGLLAFCALVTIFSIGSCVYFDYRGRQKAMELRQASQDQLKGSAKPGPSFAGRDVCSLVTNTEVGAALGTTVSSARTGPSSCRFTSSDNQSLALAVTGRGGVLALKLSAIALKGTTGRAGIVRQLVGIGDEAYVGRQGSTLMFRKGEVMVTLEVNSVGNNFQAVVAIAQKILPRLQ
jgi:hypothetical protein